MEEQIKWVHHLANVNNDPFSYIYGYTTEEIKYIIITKKYPYWAITISNLSIAMAGSRICVEEDTWFDMDTYDKYELHLKEDKDQDWLSLISCLFDDQEKYYLCECYQEEIDIVQRFVSLQPPSAFDNAFYRKNKKMNSVFAQRLNYLHPIIPIGEN